MALREGFVSIKQKTSRQNSLTNLLNQSTQQNTSAMLFKLDSDEYVPMFYQEISDIMRGFGDCEKPLRESVNLVDKILLQQLRGILQEAIGLAVERKGKPQPSQRDFEFLMRKNPIKIYRLQKHMKDLKLKRKFDELCKERPSSFIDDTDINGNLSDEDSDRDVPERFDEEKVRRLFRADRISQTLKGAQYIEYNEARRSSFYCRNSNAIRNKLRAWLKTPDDGVLSNQVFSILSYLAHETIATIVDFAILTRLNSSNRATEPFSRINSSSMHIRCNLRYPFC